jgi:hypothetical protein
LLLSILGESKITVKGRYKGKKSGKKQVKKDKDPKKVAAAKKGWKTIRAKAKKR